MIPLFASMTRQQFDSIAEKHGLVCTACTQYEVRYENGQVFLSINFDNGCSFMLDLEIGQKHAAPSEHAFSLAEILRLEGVPDAALANGSAAIDPIALRSGLVRFAELTDAHASGLLSGDDLSFLRLAGMRDSASSARRNGPAIPDRP